MYTHTGTYTRGAALLQRHVAELVLDVHVHRPAQPDKEWLKRGHKLPEPGVVQVDREYRGIALE